MRHLLIVLVALQWGFGGAQELVFEGFPSKRVQSNVDERRASELRVSETRELAVRITYSQGRYLWASHDNTPLIRTESGIYITYFATDGSGYIRTLNPVARETFLRQSPDGRIGQVTYSEHLLSGLTSITYYGR